MRALFGISYLGLKLCILTLGDYILVREIILGVFCLGLWLNLLTLSSPCWGFSIRRRGLDGRELLRKTKRISSRMRERHWNLSDILREENVLGAPQLGVSRDSCSVEHFYLSLSTVVLAHSCHLLCQPSLRFLHPTFIGSHLRNLRSFPGHPSCIFSFLQLNLEIQNQLSLGNQLYLSYVKLFALVLGLHLHIL